MKNSLLVFFIILFYLLTPCCFAGSDGTIKLAVFDNPQADASRSEISSALIDSYLAGINVAIQVAAQDHIKIEEKVFFHTENVFDTLHQAADVKSWRPNVIMGLYASNDFLMAKSFFGDQLTLSVSATDPKLSNLPKSFYSLGVPDQYLSKTIIEFISKEYSKANIFIMIGAESKESVDLGNLLVRNYKQQHPELNATEHLYLTEDMNILNMKNIMDGYKPGDVIILLSRGYYSSINLINKINQYMNPIKPVFILTSDNWGDNRTPDMIKGTYEAFRTDTLADAQDTNEYKVFAENYQKIYHSAPKDTISFVTYRTVMSFVTALKTYPSPHGMPTTQAVLWSYQQALIHNPNWFRPTHYTVYKLSPTREEYFETLRQP